MYMIMLFLLPNLEMDSISNGILESYVKEESLSSIFNYQTIDDFS